MALISNLRQIITDMKFDADVNNAVHSNTLFQRLTAKKIRFTGVNFRYAIFDNCYLRDCNFDSCDFTGCKFIGSNLHGTHFEGCKFDYCAFERTFIESEILTSNAPAYENLKQKFARTLRINFQSIGDPDSVNQAILFELSAKREHLLKAWESNEAYYRKKYKGWTRLSYFFQWLSFWFLDFLWGNGESILKLVRSLCLILIAMSVVDYFQYQDTSFWLTLIKMPGIFLGAIPPPNYSNGYISLVSLARLISVGLIVSIIVKRFNRR